MYALTLPGRKCLLPLVCFANVRFMDNFEWNEGLLARFGTVYCDFETFERTPKDSAKTVIDVSDQRDRNRTPTDPKFFEKHVAKS